MMCLACGMKSLCCGARPLQPRALCKAHYFSISAVLVGPKVSSIDGGCLLLPEWGGTIAHFTIFLLSVSSLPMILNAFFYFAYSISPSAFLHLRKYTEFVICKVVLHFYLKK